MTNRPTRNVPNPRSRASERRRENRIPLGLDFAVPVEVRMGTVVEKGLARNISEGGMLVQLDRVLPIGRRVEIHMVGRSGRVTLRGEIRHQVAWQHSGGPDRKMMYGVGVRFLDPKDDSLPLTSWVWSTDSTLH
jgi:hypothetical protein